MRSQYYAGWVENDPAPLLARHGAIPFDNPKHPLIQKLAATADSSIPEDRETYSSAERVLKSLALIGELPTTCNGPGCGHSFRGSLREPRVTLIIQEGNGMLARPLTYCPTCFESQYVPLPKAEPESLDATIWRLKGQGLSQAEIGREIGKSQQTVSRRWAAMKPRRKSTAPAIN
jgi:hypothetical protein